MINIKNKIDNQDGTITLILSKNEYNRINEQLEWLQCLESAGVDNWEGIDEAISMLREEHD